MHVGRGSILHLTGEVVPPFRGFLGMDVEVDFGARVEFFERDPDDTGQSMRIDLRFAMQDFARDRERQVDDFPFDAAIVTLPFQRELVDGMANFGAMFRETSIEFGTELLLGGLASPFESFGLLMEVSFLGSLAGIERTAGSAAWEFGFGIGEGRDFGNGLPLGAR